jgi:sarcosine oxidase subunit alpha
MRARFRTAAGGARIERATRLRFRFDGRTYFGVAGDTLASALLANGVHLVARSFKYHRPRGILTAGSEEPCALVTVRRDAARCTPNLRATQVELYPGLRASSQNRWPSLRLDVGALADPLRSLIPAGFYYKTFMWPRGAWRALYEPVLRAAAGLGKAPRRADPDRYTQRYAHCDVLVVGAGPAGLAAAQAAASQGARVILCDEQSEPGGSLLGTSEETIGGESASAWLARVRSQLSSCPRVTLLSRTCAFGYLPHNSIGLAERLTDHLARPAPHAPRERLWQVRAREVVLCTGAIERPLVFPGNDRPGILLAGAARTYLNRYGVLCGRRVVLVTGCDDGYRAALDLKAAGVAIAMVADLRERASGVLPEAARAAGIPVEARMTVLGTRGRLRIRSIRLAQLSVDGTPRRVFRVACDLVLMSGGYTPSVHLFSQSRGELRWDESLGAFVPGQALERVRAAGACRGVAGLEQAVQDGLRAGQAAASAAGHGPPGAQESAPAALETDGACLPARAAPLPASQPAFVDWQNDVTLSDLALAVREGFRSVEHIKRYTTLGMGTDQGKTGNLNAVELLAQELQESVAQIGHTTFRMPYTPVSFGSFAGLSRGALFAPARLTPLHEWAAAHGALFEDDGLWKRVRCFPRRGEDAGKAIMRECLTVRRGCGIFDTSAQGRIEVAGPDALTFLERLYISSLTDLAVGGCRYGLLLRADGSIQDDGIIARVAPERFHISTAAGGDSRVLELMEEHRQGVWRELKVWITSTTDAWAVMAVQGPLSRLVLQEVVEDIDLSAQGLPHMSMAQARIGAVPGLLLRLSFTGELGFEVRVPSDYGEAVWEAILRAGEKHGGVTPYGTGAMSVLRTEKGYVLLGQDTDSITIPEDVGLGWPIGDGKPDFVGKRSLERASMSAPDRAHLVGLLPLDPRVTLEEGAQVVRSRGSRPPLRPLGHVTSSCHSPTLGRSIALALVRGGRGRMGQILHVPGIRGGGVAVQVTSPVFYDPEGERLHV